MRDGQTDHWTISGPPLCVLRCMRESALTIDGVPHCVECADLVVDREIAIALRPDLIASLPPLTYGREAYDAYRRTLGPSDPRSISLDSDELRERRAVWAASPHNPANGAPDPNAGRGRPVRTARKPPATKPQAPVEPEPQLRLL